MFVGVACALRLNNSVNIIYVIFLPVYTSKYGYATQFITNQIGWLYIAV